MYYENRNLDFRESNYYKRLSYAKGKFHGMLEFNG